jgi:predicted membrane channel-forming protein YqfA (hemolysin III family)
MPANVFLHYLHRARWNVWGEHSEDVWLKRLPKKLNESLTASTGGQTDPDLLFGWGVHIINGPNHAALGLLLAIGVSISLVVSLVIFGAAKTQEQAFGVGSYLLAIIACIMAAVYFKLTDQ